MICFFTLGQFECWTSRGGSRGALWQGMSVKWQRLFNMRHLHFSVTHPTLGTPGLGFIGYAIAGGVMFWKLGEQENSMPRRFFLGRCLCGLALQLQQQIVLAAPKFNLSNALSALSPVSPTGEIVGLRLEGSVGGSGILLIVCHRDNDGCHSWASRIFMKFKHFEIFAFKECRVMKIAHFYEKWILRQSGTGIMKLLCKCRVCKISLCLCARANCLPIFPRKSYP